MAIFFEVCDTPRERTVVFFPNYHLMFRTIEDKIKFLNDCGSESRTEKVFVCDSTLLLLFVFVLKSKMERLLRLYEMWTGCNRCYFSVFVLLPVSTCHLRKLLQLCELIQHINDEACIIHRFNSAHNRTGWINVCAILIIHKKHKLTPPH